MKVQMTTYTIERIDTLDDDVKEFLQKEMPNLIRISGNRFNPNYCALASMLQKGVFFVCRREGIVTGFHISWLSSSPLDLRVKTLTQQLFYVKPDSGRTAYHLFKKFIDFGKSEADHINTMIGGHTNIKPSTLKSGGFEEVETLYRIRV